MGSATRLLLSPMRDDPFFGDIVLYLKGNGANNGTIFTDSSQYNHTITRRGSDIVTSTTQSKYGGSSLYSPTNVADTGLSIVNSAVFDIGTKNFTIEFWYYKTSNTYVGFVSLTQLFNLDGVDFPFTIADGSFFGGIPRISFGSNSAWTVDALEITPSAVPLNEWVHIAICRKDGFLRTFYNGNLHQSLADTSTIAAGASSPTLMGSSSGGYGSALCYIDGFRFTMAGRHDTSFNPERDTFMRD